MSSRFRKLRHDQKCKKIKLSQDMQLIHKLRGDQKRMKKAFKDVSRSAYVIAVEVFDPLPSLCIWEALGGNTCGLDSIWEETGQDCNFTRSGFKDARTVLGDGVAILSDAVRTYKRRRQESCDGVRM
ncbi:hypothetical protein Tco_0687291 [Tanacetum coccineum]